MVGDPGASRCFGSRKIGFERSLLCTVKQGRAGCQTVDKDVTVTVINIEQGVRKLTEDVTVTVSPWSQTGPGSARTHAQEKNIIYNFRIAICSPICKYTYICK